ncbi:dipeptidase 1 [Anabrus simplex]|uniref:dipeptidase 1 n=1 Tax=Anabrus simplex TaxID=316456 RepID=UPI0034DDA739
MASSLSKKWMVLCGCTVLVIIALAIALPVALTGSHPTGAIHNHVSAKEILRSVPLIDGHNDLPHNLRTLLSDQLSKFNFSANLTTDPIFNCSSCFTDLPRLRAGQIGAQFWVAYADCKSQYKDAVEQTLEQIDVIKRLIKMYPNDLQYVDSAEGIWKAFNESKIASLIAVEGGHSIDSRLGVLRLMYELGVRYLTLTHSCNTPWAQGSPAEDEEDNVGLSEFGKVVVKEMNRLGMMVDLSHVSAATMRDALNISVAPVIFSHSSARAICDHHRNVPDDVLEMVKKNDGIVMVNFFSEFVFCNGTERNASVYDVIEHINHIRNVAGVDHIGIGADYDGVSKMPEGLEDVSKYPMLFDLLEEREPNWTREDLRKLAGLNFIRVFKAVEKVRDDLKHLKPYEDLIPVTDLGNNTGCMTNVSVTV